ncbi:hypothetical protein ACFCYN_07250 [Gottfriedia sp. NPDC056225]|uniref:hypothetical protein n=1 Tax=Gottfriedia sp. NPDC056225 TaxID=3345751 RepID=UPI0035DFF3A1
MHKTNCFMKKSPYFMHKTPNKMNKNLQFMHKSQTNLRNTQALAAHVDHKKAIEYAIESVESAKRNNWNVEIFKTYLEKVIDS